MGSILPVPHFPQSDEGYCLPARAGMVLSYSWDFNATKPTLVKSWAARNMGPLALPLDDWAIQTSRLYSLRGKSDIIPATGRRKMQDFIRNKYIYQKWSATELLSTLEAGHRVIVFVWTVFLDYYQEDLAHALVIVGTAPHQCFWVQDPAQPTEPMNVSWDGLLAA